MNVLKTVLIASAVSGLFATFAHADNFRIEQVEGTVLVQDAQGFEQAANGATLLIDQQVLVKPQSALLLMGAETACFIHITSPGLYQLTPDMPCAAGQVTRLEAKLSIIPSNGGPNSALVVGYNSLEPLLVGGAFVAAVAGTVAWQALQDKSVSHP